MSDHDHDHGHGHGDADDGGVHAHVSTVKLYLGVFVALILFTILTVLVASVHLGAANLAVAVIIASAKAALVCTFFMHLSHDNRFHALIVVATVMFIGVFFAYTINDTGHRGIESGIDPQSGARTYIGSGEPAPGSWERPANLQHHEEGAKKDEKAPEHH
jgi:cytochrome c oxidase subunit 4